MPPERAATLRKELQAGLYGLTAIIAFILMIAWVNVPAPPRQVTTPTAPPTEYPCPHFSMDHTSQCMLTEKAWAVMKPDRYYEQRFTFCWDTGNGKPPPQEARDGETRKYRSPPGSGSIVLRYRLVPGEAMPGQCPSAL